RQLALLADRHEAGRDLMRQRAAEDEAARLDAGNLVDLGTSPGMHELVDGATEGACIRKQCGDVAEQDPRLRVIRNGADGSLDILINRNRCLFPRCPSLRGALATNQSSSLPAFPADSGLLRFARNDDPS